MAVAKRGTYKAAARTSPAPRKTTADGRTAASSTPTGDLISVRMTALNYARSLFGSSDGGPETVLSASKIVTQAKRFERYILGTEGGEDV